MGRVYKAHDTKLKEKIAEQQGQKAKAIEHYQKFLGLWKNADPGLPELEEANK